MASGDVDRAARWWTEEVTVRRGLGAGLSAIDATRPSSSAHP
jgi:hypothetical protein